MGPHTAIAGVHSENSLASRRSCIKCGRHLTVQQALAGPVCDDLVCKGPYLQELKAAEVARRRAARARVAKNVSGELGIPERLILVLPANLNECVALSPERLETFRGHLRRVISEVRPPQEAGDEAHVVSEVRPNAELPPESVIHSCATCRGRCCLGGAGHAFLRAETIAEFWRRHPALLADAVEAEYLQYAAPQGFADSCVYHSASGCTLPREMRADICNTFLCESLLQGLEDEPHPKICVAADGAEVHRVSIVDSPGPPSRTPVATSRQHVRSAISFTVRG